MRICIGRLRHLVHVHVYGILESVARLAMYVAGLLVLAQDVLVELVKHLWSPYSHSTLHTKIFNSALVQMWSGGSNIATKRIIVCH